MNGNAVMALGGLLALLAGIGFWAQAGEIQPPPGPVSPTMTTLADLSDEHAAILAALPAGGSGSVKQVVRGVIQFGTSPPVETQELPVTVNPEKCIVYLSPVVIITAAGSSFNSTHSRAGACVIELTPTEITVAIDHQSFLTRRLSYQIIELN